LAQRGRRTSARRGAESGLQEVTEDPAKFDGWFHEHIEKSPLVVAVPGSGRKIHMMHNLWRSDLQVLGITGFTGTAPLRGLDIAATTDGLFQDKLATQTGEAHIPSLRQCFDTKSIGDLLDNVVGDGTRTIASYANMLVISIWPPMLLSVRFNDAPTPKAADLLYGLIEVFRFQIDSGEFLMTDIEDIWIDKIIWLYLVAKGLSKTV
jgi:hypothetical protein